MGYLLISIKRAFLSLYFLVFFNGFLIACLFFFHILSVYEDGLFNSIKSSIDATIKADDTPDSIFVKSMNSIHDLMHNRADVFTGNPSNLGPQAGIFHSLAVDLNTTDGACGSYSEVLARVIRGYKYPVRIAQMMAFGKFGRHMIVEAYNGRHWVVLDPSYNLYFVRPDGQLAGFADIHNNWDYYKNQVPADYNPGYRYADVRYTNWSKIPVLMPALKKVLTLILGPQRTENISLRVFFLHIYAIYFYTTLLLETGLLLGTVRLVRIRFRQNPGSFRLNPDF